jgi:predicted DNA-binding protein
MGVFRDIAPDYENDKLVAIRIQPDNYDRLVKLGKDTGVSRCRIAEHCLMFALEILENYAGKRSVK